MNIVIGWALLVVSAAVVFAGILTEQAEIRVCLFVAGGAVAVVSAVLIETGAKSEGPTDATS